MLLMLLAVQVPLLVMLLILLPLLGGTNAESADGGERLPTSPP